MSAAGDDKLCLPKSIPLALVRRLVELIKREAEEEHRARLMRKGEA